MNRINRIRKIEHDTSATASHLCLRPIQRLRTDAEAALRDIALVLRMTQRVKESIVGNLRRETTSV